MESCWRAGVPAGRERRAERILHSTAARVVARSPDRATAFDRRSPRPTFPGDLRSHRVARSGDRATTREESEKRRV